MDWPNLIQTLGVPVTLLFAILFGLWRVLVWSGANVVQPLVGKLVEFLERQAASTEKLAVNQERCAELLGQMCRLLALVPTGAVRVPDANTTSPHP
jgi:hypothetical protein